MELLTEKELESEYKINRRTAQKWRVVGGGPEFIKAGRRVFYEREAIENWLRSRRRRSTCDPGPTKSQETKAGT